MPRLDATALATGQARRAPRPHSHQPRRPAKRDPPPRGRGGPVRTAGSFSVSVTGPPAWPGSPRPGPPGPTSHLRSGTAASPMLAPAAPLRAVPRPRPSSPTSGCRSAPSVPPSPITRQRADLIRVKLLAHFIFRRQPLCGQARDSQTALPTSLHSQVEAPTTTTLALLPGSASCAHGPVRAAAPPGNNVSCGSHVPPPVRTDRAEQLRYTPRGPKDGNTSFWSFTDKAC